MSRVISWGVEHFNVCLALTSTAASSSPQQVASTNKCTFHPIPKPYISEYKASPDGWLLSVAMMCDNITSRRSCHSHPHGPEVARVCLASEGSTCVYTDDFLRKAAPPGCGTGEKLCGRRWKILSTVVVFFLPGQCLSLTLLKPMKNAHWFWQGGGQTAPTGRRARPLPQETESERHNHTDKGWAKGKVRVCF